MTYPLEPAQFKVSKLSLEELIQYRLVMIIEKRDNKNGIVNRRPYPSSECLSLLLSEVYPRHRLVCETEEVSVSDDKKTLVKTVCRLLDEEGNTLRQHTSCDKREDEKYGKEFFDDKAFQAQESKTSGYVLRSMGVHRYIMPQLMKFYDNPVHFLKIAQQLPGNDYQGRTFAKPQPQQQQKPQSQPQSKLKLPNTEEENWTLEKAGLQKTGGDKGLTWQHLIEDYPLFVQDKEGQTKRGASYLHQLSGWEGNPGLMKVAKSCLEIRKSFKKEILAAVKEKDIVSPESWIDSPTGISVCGQLTWRDLAQNKTLPRREPAHKFLENGAYQESVKEWADFCGVFLSSLDFLKEFPVQQNLFPDSELPKEQKNQYQKESEVGK